MFPSSFQGSTAMGSRPSFQLHAHYMWLYCTLGLYIASAAALVNVTVGRYDPGITYLPMGEWREVWPGVRTSGSPGATASLNFTGVAIYYEGWLWTAPTLISAKVDDAPPMVLALTDYGMAGEPGASAMSTTPAIILIASGLEDVQHQLVISRVEGQREAIVGSFIYSTDHPPRTDPSKVSTTMRSSTSQNPAGSSTPVSASSSKTAVKVYSAVFGVLGFVVAILIPLIIFVIRRRRHKREAENNRNNNSNSFISDRSRKHNPEHNRSSSQARLYPFTSTSNSNFGTDNHAKGGLTSPSKIWTKFDFSPRTSREHDVKLSPLHKELNLEPHIVIATPMEKDEVRTWQID